MSFKPFIENHLGILRPTILITLHFVIFLVPLSFLIPFLAMFAFALILWLDRLYHYCFILWENPTHTHQAV